jgi:tetratricopeptide (TPR) repeat protein
MPSQVVTVESGSGNVVVQIHGDGNTVDLGRPHLRLTLYEALAARSRSDAARLDAFARAVPLVGRHAERAQLDAFLDASDTIAARVLTGEAGSGKTRLALETCIAARARGWDAGFASAREVQRFLAQQNLADWGWRRPTLVVIDNVAALGRALRDWLAELADNPGQDGKPLRVLLLERETDPTGGWWTLVFGGAARNDSGAATLLQPAQPQRLSPLNDRAVARGLLDAAFLHAAGTALEPVRADRVMASPWATHPLMIQMAAIQLARDPGRDIAALDRDALCLRIAQLELDRLADLARAASLEPTLVQHLAVGVTLAEGMERASFLKWADAESRATGWSAAVQPAALAACLGEAIASADERLGALAPDLVAEAAVLIALDHPRGDAVGMIRRCHAAAGDTVIRTLVRTAQDFGATRDAPARWLRALFDTLMTDDVDAARRLVELLPDKTLALRPLAHDATERLATHYAQGEAIAVEGKQFTMHTGHHLVLSHNHSLRASEQGRHEDALRAAEEAERFLRQSIELIASQAAKRPRLSWWLMRRDWAAAICRRAGCCEALSDNAAALALYVQAIDILRGLPESRAVHAEATLSLALHNQSQALARSGRLDDAITAAREALTLDGDAAVDAADAERAARRAHLLRTLGAHLRAAGEGDEALRCVDEAVRLLEPLADAQPDAHLEDWAQALVSRAMHLADHGRDDDALRDARQAVAAHRLLEAKAAGSGASFRAELARALSLCAKRAAARSQWDEAAAAHAEAVALQRAGGKVSSVAHALLSQAHTLFEAARIDDEHGDDEHIDDARIAAARGASDEAIALFRTLPAEPGSPGPNLLRALGERSLGEYLAGQPACSLPFFVEQIWIVLRLLDESADPRVVDLMQHAVGGWFGACEACGQEPAPELLEALKPLLAP